MKDRKDIFNGNVKKEFFSYILVNIIFITVLIVGGSGAFLWLGLWADYGPIAAIVFVRILGAAGILLGIFYFCATILTIRRYPKYEKLRRFLFNSDYYFTGCDSLEYHGRRRHRYVAAFNAVVVTSAVTKSMGKKRPLKYKVYSALAILTGLVVPVATVITLLIFLENEALRSRISDDILGFIFICVLLTCLVFTVLFYYRALIAAVMAPYDEDRWRFELYDSLVDISPRKNNRKLKFWYETSQIPQIEDMVKAANQAAELKLERKGDKLVAFKIVDTSTGRKVFEGRFIK